MTEYVLEILDGDRAGEIVELTSETVTFGRRAGNSVVLSDEKVSGQHASLTLEGGQWVLRDHDSTNGTLMDGRRIEEVGLTANDIFQLGRVLFGFKEAGAPTPEVGQDMSVRTVDSARLANTKRGGGIGLLLVLVLILGGGAAYWFYGGGNEQVGGGGRQPKSVIRVSGNMLRSGSDMESEGGWKAVSGLQFSWEESNFRAANSGNGYQSVFGPDSADSPHYALARTTGEYLVSSGSGLKATAYLQTNGAAKAAIRLRFWSTAEGVQSVALFTGSKPASYNDYTEVSFSAGVPSGCDHAAVEILALLPDADSEVAFDDVSLEEGGAKAHGFMTKAGQRVAGCGGSLAVMDVNSVVLSGLRPITTDLGLLELDKAGLLCLSDNGMDLQVVDADGAVTLNTTGGSGVSLMFDAGVASSGVLARKAEGGFRNHANTFELADVDSLLIGYGTSRLLVRLSSSAAMQGAVSGGSFVLSLPSSREVSLVYDFSAARDKSRTLLGDAQAQFREGSYEGVLSKVDTALSLYPHDDRQQRAVTKLRTQVRNLQLERVAYLEAELANAVYFESLGGYSRIRSELQSLVRVYGQEQLLDPEKVATMLTKVEAAIGRIEAEEGGVARQKLQTLAGVYGKAGSAELVALINQYIKDYLPAAGKEEGK
jgi:hypothetical protein